MRSARVSEDVLVAVAALLCVGLGARLLAGDARPPAGWCYGAAALGCAHAAALGALTVAAGRRATAAAWAPALLWPLAGPATVAAALAALVGAAIIASRLRGRGRAAIAAALGLAALGVLVGAASATERAPEPPARAAHARPPAGAAATEPPGRDEALRAPRGDERSRERGGGEHALAPRGDDRPRERGDAEPARAPGGDEAPASGDDERRPGGRGRRLGAGAAVRAYYGALDARRFERAWRLLTPAVRASFGGFATWRSGFGDTRSSRPDQLRATERGEHATVGHLLTATDATACGPAVRRFALRWTLRRTPAGWRATAVTGRLLSEALPPCG